MAALVVGPLLLFGLSSAQTNTAAQVGGAPGRGTLIPDGSVLGSTDWPTYLQNPSRTGANIAETAFSPQNASELSLQWRFQTGALIAASPSIANGTVYVGSWDGYEYALNVSRGTELWQSYLGVTDSPPDCGGGRGITSAATILNGTVYAVGGTSYLYALNASTGKVLWKTFVGNTTEPNGGYVWDSPLLYRGAVYIGLANMCDPPTVVQGQLFEVSLATHTIVHEFNTTRPGQAGAGIWGSPAVIPALNTIYFTTGNGPTSAPYQEAVIAVNATTLAPVGHWQIPQHTNQSIGDGDFGSTPTYFTNAQGRPYILVENKNGIFYAFNATNLSAGPVWMDYLAVSGNCPECGDGSISPAAFDGKTLYVGGGITTLNGKLVPGAIRALNTSTGKILWAQPAGGYVLGGLAYANGLVFDGANNSFEVRSAATGAILYQFQANGPIVTAISLAEGHVFVSSEDHSLYVFGFGGPRWAEQFSPPPISGSGSAMDVKDGYVLTMGGCSSQGCPNAETWRYSHGVWTNLTPPSLTHVDSPSARVNTSMTYDASTGYVLLFGGLGAQGIALNDTWTFSAGRWTSLSTPVAPSPRESATLAYLSNGTVLLFGGSRPGPHGPVELGDTWTFDAGVWTNITSTLSQAPSSRDSAAAAFGATPGELLLFGGRSGASILRDTWTFASGRWTEVTGSVTAPEARYSAGLVYLPSSNDWILTGGSVGGGRGSATTWQFAKGNWSNVSSSAGVGPGARWGFTTAYDGPDGYLVVFGGLKGSSGPQNDTWKYASGKWALIPRQFPGPGRFLASSTYDVLDSEVLIFGGRTSSGAVLAGTLAFGSSSYSTPCSSCVPGVSSPSPRYGAAMAYDSADREVVLFGGWNATGRLLDDTWTFAKGHWHNVTASVINSTNTPSPRAGASLANDPQGPGALLFGGCLGTGCTPTNDTWRFSGGVWTLLHLSTAPPARSFAAMSWDTEAQEVLLFGGNGTSGLLNDTWTFSGGSWSKLHLTSSPSARGWSGLTDDPAEGGVLLFGGVGPSGSFPRDLWEFRNGTWTSLSLSGPPLGREGAVWSVDFANDQIVLFGGQAIRSGTPTTDSDTWFLGPALA
ncbi:MAG TPA: kelch repeat-containing protein [Thermoplasmata archaeon]|nr:kelch repeat-containing protein [Thermoplasmata archaeon]